MFKYFMVGVSAVLLVMLLGMVAIFLWWLLDEIQKRKE